MNFITPKIPMVNYTSTFQFKNYNSVYIIKSQSSNTVISIVWSSYFLILDLIPASYLITRVIPLTNFITRMLPQPLFIYL